jgi:SAM-dependent methyltransferase
MSFWDERYSVDEYVYGVEPNDFLRESAWRIPSGHVVCLADGEGRNSVFLASLGYTVTAVDLSVEGLRKAERLARERGVSVECVHADLADYQLSGSLSGIISIFAHVPRTIRARIHAGCPQALVQGGVFLLEAYRPEQLAFGTGGPRDAALLPTLTELEQELRPLDLVVARDVERDIQEGLFHGGRSATVQIIGIRTA